MRDAPVNDKLRIELGFAATSGTGSDHPFVTAQGRCRAVLCLLNKHPQEGGARYCVAVIIA